MPAKGKVYPFERQINVASSHMPKEKQKDPNEPSLGKSVGRATRYKSQKPNIYAESADVPRTAAIYVRVSRDEDADGASLLARKTRLESCRCFS